MRKIFYVVIAVVALVALSLSLQMSRGKSLPANARLSDANLLAGRLSTAPLTTEELVGFARSYIDKDKLMFKDLEIGSYNGHKIRVSYPCGDICPADTVRIIRYDILGSECAGAGGELRRILVPIGRAVTSKEFCFPKPIIDAGTY